MYSITYLDSTTHEQTIFCRQLFAGDVMGSQPMKSKGTALNDNKFGLNIQVMKIEIHFQWDGGKKREAWDPRAAKGGRRGLQILPT